MDSSSASSLSVPYKTFLYWLLLIELILFGLYLAWDTGILAQILVQDSTRISAVILIVFAFASMHCAWRSVYLARQGLMLSQLRHSVDILSTQQLAPQSPLSQPSLLKSQEIRAVIYPAINLYSSGISSGQEYLNGLLNGSIGVDRAGQDKILLSEVMAESLRGSHQVGWFITSIIIKLGLLGTVVGFVIMLSSISGLDQLDISDIKQLMQQMTQGMGVAMNTTMVGLVSSMGLGVQYLLLDRCADGLVVKGVNVGQALTAFIDSLEDENERSCNSSANLSTANSNVMDNASDPSSGA